MITEDYHGFEICLLTRSGAWLYQIRNENDEIVVEQETESYETGLAEARWYVDKYLVVDDPERSVPAQPEPGVLLCYVMNLDLSALREFDSYRASDPDYGCTSY